MFKQWFSKGSKVIPLTTGDVKIYRKEKQIISQIEEWLADYGPYDTTRMSRFEIAMRWVAVSRILRYEGDITHNVSGRDFQYLLNFLSRVFAEAEVFSIWETKSVEDIFYARSANRQTWLPLILESQVPISTETLQDILDNQLSWVCEILFEHGSHRLIEQQYYKVLKNVRDLPDETNCFPDFADFVRMFDIITAPGGALARMVKSLPAYVVPDYVKYRFWIHVLEKAITQLKDSFDQVEAPDDWIIEAGFEHPEVVRKFVADTKMMGTWFRDTVGGELRSSRILNSF